MKNVLWTVALGALLCATPALAQQSEEDAEVTKMAKEHYKLGLDAYKAGKYDVAIKELKKAYLLKRLPALLLNIAATYRKMGDLDLALHFYKKYLDEAPAEAKDRGDVQSTIAEINAEKAGGGLKEAELPSSKSEAAASKEEAAPPPPSRPSQEWAHNPVDAAPPDTPLDVRVASPVMKGVKVFLNFRGAGEEMFRSVVMKRRGTEKVGRIPADAMQGKAVQYFIEAKDTAGTVVKASGSAVSPNVVMIDPSAPVQMLASLEESRSRQAEEREVQQQQQEEEPRHKARNLDEEEAPVMGQAVEPRKRRVTRSGGPSKFGPLFWGGVGAMAGGAALLGGGIAFGAVAQGKASTLAMDAASPVDVNNNKIYFNNDPNAGSTQEADLAAQGKLFDTLGIAFDVIGGVALVGGATMMILDQLVFNGGHKDKPKKRRARPQPVEDEVSSIKNWYVSPATSHNFTGLAGGFQF